MPLYGAKAASATTSDLYTIDYTTAVAISIGPTGFALTGLAFDPTTGVLYGATSPQDATTGHRRALVTIDPETGVGTFIAQFNGTPGVRVMADIAFDSDGNLYGWSGETSNIHAIDKATAAFTTPGSLGISPSSAALSFDSSDTLYLIARVAGTTKLYTVDPATNTPTLVSDLMPFSSHFPSAATFDSNDLIWWLNGGGGGSGVRLRTLDTSGNWTVVVDSPSNPGDNFDSLIWSVGEGPPPPPPQIFTKIKFGDGLKVTDEGDGVIRVDVDTT